jgi:zinc protease
MLVLFWGLLVQVVPALAYDPAAQLPFDEKIRHGTLENGLSYFVRENTKPEKRADLRLIVKAGAIDEDEDQRGLAHFVEHMMFNGTDNFAGNEIVVYLESIGARFGADLNATTDFDATIYMLHVPTDKPGLMDDGLRVLSEFAAHATFDSSEVEKERGVVLDEWRRGRGAGARIRDEQLPVVLRGSRYAERLPIGKPEVIKTAEREKLLRFYRDWYRPERMAVIAVGDFKGEDIEKAIRETFAKLPPTSNLRERQEWGVPAESDTAYILSDDPEVTRTSVEMSWKKPVEPEPTNADYRRDLVLRMVMSMLNDRYAEKAREPNPPFLGAGLSLDQFGKKNELVELHARVKEGKEAEGLQGMVTEMRRAVDHGFLESEVERTRKDFLAGIEASYSERGKTTSEAYVSELSRHFLIDEPVPGIDAEVLLWREMLPKISAQDCSQSLRELAQGKGWTVAASRPTRPKMVSETELKKSLREASQGKLEPYVDAGAGSKLLEEARTAGTATRQSVIPEIGVEEWVLSNGLRVYLKPTDFQDDEILFLGSAPGGFSVAPVEKLLSAQTSLSILGESGYGGHTAIELGKILAGKVASCRPYFDERQHGISGESTVADLQTALELGVLMMTNPNRDEAAFARVMERLEADVRNRDADPGVRFQDRLTAINSSDSPRRKPITKERLSEIKLDDALDFYRHAFANAADFTFFFVGNLESSKVIPLIEKTLGSLPTKGKAESAWAVQSYPQPKETVKEIVRAGVEPRAQTAITFRSYEGSDPDEWHRIRTATSILERRLRLSLREALGATYGVSAGYTLFLVGPAEGKIRIQYGCDPADAERLGRETFRILEELRTDGPAEDELVTEKTLQLREVESSLEQNGFWLRSLESLSARGRPLAEILDRKSRIEALTREGLHESLRSYFVAEPYTWVSWLPEEGQALQR